MNKTLFSHTKTTWSPYLRKGITSGIFLEYVEKAVGKFLHLWLKSTKVEKYFCICYNSSAKN